MTNTFIDTIIDTFIHSALQGFQSTIPSFIMLLLSHLFLRRRSELFGLLRSNGSRHIEGQHELIVAELLVVLEFGDKAVGKRHNGLDAMLQLTVTEIVEQLTHLESRQGEETNVCTGAVASLLHAALTRKRLGKHPSPLWFHIIPLVKETLSSRRSFVQCETEPFHV